MERRVSHYKERASRTPLEILREFTDCPFMGCSRYYPVKDESKNMVVRAYFAVDNVTLEEVVIKLIERGKPCSPNVVNELQVHWLSYGHPYIAELKDVFVTDSYLAIVMRFVPGLALDAVIERHGALSEETARSVFQQLLLAVKFLHDSGYMNRDIKVNNIIYDDMTGSIALQDFMYSRHDQINSDPREAFRGLPYTAPEVLVGKEGEQADADGNRNVWEMGVCLFKMVTGKFPFERPGDGKPSYRTVPIVISRISRMEYNIPESLSETLKDLLNRIFVSNTKERIDLEHIMAHPWVNEAPWPCSVDSIRERMSQVRCPVTKEKLDEMVEASQRRSHVAPLGETSNADVVDRVCDSVTDDVMLEESSRERIRDIL